MPEGTLKINPEDTSTLPPPPPKPARTQKPHTKHRWWLWVLAVVVLVGGFIFYRRYQADEAAKKAKANATQKAIPVATATATTGDIGVYVEALGTVTPVYTVTVTSRVQ